MYTYTNVHTYCLTCIYTIVYIYLTCMYIHIYIGGEGLARELMVITGLSAQELVDIARACFSTNGGRAAGIAGDERLAATGIETRGRRPVANAADVAEVVMGSEAWDAYKNNNFKTMHGPRKPQGSRATTKRLKDRKLQLKGSLEGWTLQIEPEHFAGTDTKWTMDQPLTWLPPDGNVNHRHLETLGNMISEAFHQHKMKMYNEEKKVKKSFTAAESSEWNGDKSVHGADFFKPNK